MFTIIIDRFFLETDDIRDIYDILFRFWNELFVIYTRILQGVVST